MLLYLPWMAHAVPSGITSVGKINLTPSFEQNPLYYDYLNSGQEKSWMARAVPSGIISVGKINFTPSLEQNP